MWAGQPVPGVGQKPGVATQARPGLLPRTPEGEVGGSGLVNSAPGDRGDGVCDGRQRPLALLERRGPGAEG